MVRSVATGNALWSAATTSADSCNPTAPPETVDDGTWDAFVICEQIIERTPLSPGRT